MEKFGWTKALIVVFPLMLSVGCATTSQEAAPGATGAETAGAGTTGGPSGTALAEGQRAPTVSAGADSLLSKRRVHFAFDSSTIDNEARDIIKAHADYLAANPGIKLRLEGHCDERGTREYNLALGERRAQSVERLVKALGVAANRVTVASYGEEKPLDAEHNESAWRLNRRVEIMY